MAEPAGTGIGSVACSRSGLGRELTNHQKIFIAMQPLLNCLRRIFDRMLQSTFPDNSHAPAKSVEHFCMTSVAVDIPLEFLPPELLVGSGSGCVAATFMSVPETAVDEYHRPVFREHKVRGTGQRSHMKSISKPSGEKKGTKRSFWPSVLPANTRHHAAALRSGHDAHGLGGIPSGCLQKQQTRAYAMQSERMKTSQAAIAGSLASS